MRLVYILAKSTCVLFSVLTTKQIITCSEVDDRLQMQVIASSIGTPSEPWDDPSALHCPVSKDWVFNANYGAKPVVYSQSPPTSDLIPSKHVASI